jgi:cyclopropane-fatty-acyl-phospholipid synthase
MLLRNKVIKFMSGLEKGTLRLQDPLTKLEFGKKDLESEPTPEIIINNLNFYSKVALGGTLGAAESYYKQEWDAEHLTEVIQVFIKNIAILNKLESGLYFFKFLFEKFLNLSKKNTIQKAKDNIFAHYDLGNDFFELFLDKSMMYSSAIFPNENISLEEASIIKMRTLAQKLDIQAGDSILEIGSGWGGFAIYLAENYDCNITTITISKAQYNYAFEKIKQKKLENKIKIILTDYREVSGVYDKIVSIEMLEAVGHQYYKDYFQLVDKVLKRKGKAVIQVITIADQYYEKAKNEVDFIKKYIFPGSCIPSLTALCEAMKKHSSLRVIGLEDIGLDYAKTLYEWRMRFNNNIDKIKALGFDEQFIRLWNFYFCYCEAGFKEQHLSDFQLILHKN